MPYVMENRSGAYVSISGLGNFGAEIPAAHVPAIKAAIRKLQGVVRAKTDGKWGDSTQARLVTFVKTKMPALASLPGSSISPITYGQLPLQNAGMSLLEISNANVGWMCWAKPSSNCAVLKNGVAITSAIPAAPAVPAEWMADETVPTDEESGFFDKYWWLIAVGALGVGGFVFWKMKQQKTLPAAAPVTGW